MARNYSRKQFLQLSSLATVAMLLGCESPKEETGNASVVTADQAPDTTGTEQSKTPGVKLIRKDAPRYEELRKIFNKRFDLFPAVIALCTSTQDVSEAVLYAKQHQLAVTVKSGGHSMEGFSSNNDGLMIHLSGMNEVEFLPDHKIRIQPGCTLAHLYDQVLPEGRIIPAGSCGSVALGGLTTGGGYGLFSRQFGLTCDHVLEATLVDGNGQIRSTKEDPELLWALRGGGSGNFGVVTEFIFRSHPAPETLQAYHFKARKLDAAHAKSLLEKWFVFSAQLPLSCFSAYVLNGSTLNVLVTDFGESSAELQDLLRSFAGETDEFRSGGPGKLPKMLKNYYGSKVPLYFKNSSAGLYKDFNEISGCIENVLAQVIDNKGMIYQVNTLGGAIADPEFEKNSSYPHRSSNYISELQAYWENPSREQHLADVSRTCLQHFSDHGIRTQYINYCSLDFKDWESAYYGNNYERLKEVKRKYDPENTIRHPQSIRI